MTSKEGTYHYAKILDPDSKLGTYDHLGSYYEQPDFGYVHILRTMDIMAAHYDEYISHLFEHSKKIIRRNTSVCYYDCSNYYVIDEEEKYDGFYAVATNLDDNAKDIIEISSNRYMIEDCFRVMKTNFSARPVFHQNRERIIAHFMICYTALLVYRLLEAKLDKNKTHFSIENITETLKNMEVVNVGDMYYMSTYNGSQICTALNTVFDLELDKKYYLPKELNKKIKKIST